MILGKLFSHAKPVTPIIDEVSFLDRIILTLWNESWPMISTKLFSYLKPRSNHKWGVMALVQMVGNQ